MRNVEVLTNDKHVAVNAWIGSLQFIHRAALGLRDLVAVVTSHDGVRRRPRIVVGRSSRVSAGGLVDSRVSIATRDCVICDCLICALNIRPLPAEIFRELVAGAWLVWSDLDRPDVRRICLVHVKQATSPVLDACWAVGVAGIPNAKMESRRTLGILVIAISLVIILHGSNDFAVDQPFDSLFVPVVGVRMERACWVVDCLLSAAVVVTGDTFAEVVSLDETVVALEVVAGPLPIKLVFVVAHENTAGDQARSWSRLDLNVYTTEHQVVLGPDVRCIVSFDEGEVGTRVAVEYHIGIICENPVTR